MKYEQTRTVMYDWYIGLLYHYIIDYLCCTPMVGT